MQLFALSCGGMPGITTVRIIYILTGTPKYLRYRSSPTQRGQLLLLYRSKLKERRYAITQYGIHCGIVILMFHPSRIPGSRERSLQGSNVNRQAAPEVDVHRHILCFLAAMPSSCYQVLMPQTVTTPCSQKM